MSPPAMPPISRESSATPAASEAEIARTADAERDGQDAVGVAAKALADAGEASAAAREARAGAAARADAHVERRMEFARVCGERFECPPPLLPERLGFDSEHLGDPELEKETLDRLTAERERIGPVNLVAEQELANSTPAARPMSRKRTSWPRPFFAFAARSAASIARAAYACSTRSRR
jgi:chromosome segregation protein